MEQMELGRRGRAFGLAVLGTLVLGGGIAPITLAQGDVSSQAIRSFSTQEVITVRDNSSGNPYPSRLEVTGLTGTIVDVELTLRNITHPLPDDMDIILEAPGGQAALVMSDVGGTQQINTVTLNIAETFGNELPDDGPLLGGNYGPADYDDDSGDSDEFGDPGPGTDNDSMDVYDGGVPNGFWRLYVRDDTAAEGNGSINGWGVTITTSNTGPVAVDDVYRTDEDEQLRVRRPGVLGNDRDPDNNDDLTVTLVDGPRRGRLKLESNGSFTYTPKKDDSGKVAFTYQVSDGAATDNGRVEIIIRERNN